MTSAPAGAAGIIPAAGTIPWRRHQGRLEVALVHRPRYDDWSWPKGKLEPGEEWPTAATRETAEETGLVVRLGRPLPPAGYTVLDRQRGLGTKEVRYWAAQVVGGDGRLVNEIDEVVWLEPAAAHDRLDYARDRDQLRALLRADQSGSLDTWPLAIVRHASAVHRSAWHQDDPLRPLSPAGARRARAIVPILSAYGIERLVTSPSTRCADTLRPYAEAGHHPLRLRPALSEEAHEADRSGAAERLVRVLRKPVPAAVCSHGPVLPSLLAVLAERLAADPADGDLLAAAVDANLAKGEVLVVHVHGAGPDAEVVAVERHQP